MTTDPYTVMGWAAWSPSDDGLTLHVAYPGSSSAVATRARVTETPGAVRVVLEKPAGDELLNLRWRAAAVLERVS